MKLLTFSPWVSKLLFCAAWALIAGGADAKPQAQSQPKDPPKLSLRTVSPDGFCAGLEESFRQHARKNGYTAIQQKAMATRASQAVVAELRKGNSAPYVDAKALARFAPGRRIPVHKQYLPLAALLGRSLSIERNVVLAFSVTDLRFIPHTQKGRALVVVAESASALTPARAQKVAAVAAGLDIVVNAIWVGPGGSSRGAGTREAGALPWLVAKTNGVFVDLGRGRGAACGSRAVEEAKRQAATSVPEA